MQIGMIPGHTRICGKSQGYLGLPLKDIVRNDPVNGAGTPAMVTAWIPSPTELQALCLGAAVYVTILGSIPPPMLVETGEPPE